MHRANPSNGRIFELDDCVTVHHQYNDVNNQQDAKNVSFINLFKSAQHVSGDKFAHSQEHFLIAYTDGFRNINKRKSCCIFWLFTSFEELLFTEVRSDDKQNETASENQ